METAEAPMGTESRPPAPVRPGEADPVEAVAEALLALEISGFWLV
jgi:hypothetical protein